MRAILATLVTFACLLSCSSPTGQPQRPFATRLLINGTWVLTHYMEGLTGIIRPADSSEVRTIVIENANTLKQYTNGLLVAEFGFQFIEVDCFGVKEELALQYDDPYHMIDIIKIFGFDRLILSGCAYDGGASFYSRLRSPRSAGRSCSQ